MTGLFIGRFQPFHLGHLSVVKQAIKETNFLIIGIGSAEDNHSPDNPFTADERFEMIKTALDEAKISPKKYTIIPVRNINNYDRWVNHVEQIVPKFDTIYTGSKIVRGLFEAANKKTAAEKHHIKSVKFIHDISGTKVRAAMLKNESWQSLIPKTITKYLKKIDGIERLREIANVIPAPAPLAGKAGICNS